MVVPKGTISSPQCPPSYTYTPPFPPSLASRKEPVGAATRNGRAPRCAGFWKSRLRRSYRRPPCPPPAAPPGEDVLQRRYTGRPPPPGRVIYLDAAKIDMVCICPYPSFSLTQLKFDLSCFRAQPYNLKKLDPLILSFSLEADRGCFYPVSVRSYFLLEGPCALCCAMFLFFSFFFHVIYMYWASFLHLKWVVADYNVTQCQVH
jgi:hypothetical protein